MKNSIIKIKKITLFLTIFAGIFIFQTNLSAQTPLTFKDSQGNTITFPQGELSFADRVVSVNKGTSPATNKTALDPNSALGIPDYEEDTASYLSLGKNGSITIEFTDNYLIDIDGPDLWIFEIGPLVESTKVAISKDGTNWINVGIVKGSTSGVDIRPFVKPGDRFSFVRVTDNNNSAGEYAGADIDAIGAIGTISKEEADQKQPQRSDRRQSNPSNRPPVNNNQNNNNDCCNTLRIEMKDGTVQLIDLSKVRSIIPVCNN